MPVFQFAGRFFDHTNRDIENACLCAIPGTIDADRTSG